MIGQRTAAGVAFTVAGPVDSERPPLIFVHGGCHGSWCWADMQAWFAARGWRSAALDWFHHGDSERLAHEHFVARSIADVASEIETVIDAVGAPRPVLVGHSMGGLASLNYAAASGRLSALALFTPVVPQQFGEVAIDLPVDLDAQWGPPPPEVAR